MADALIGGCMCGAVRDTCKTGPAATMVCHSLDCLKRSGSPFLTTMFYLQSDLEMNGELKFFDKGTDAANVMTRAFCGTSGSHLSGNTTGYFGHVFVAAGTLDDPSRVTPNVRCWMPRSLHWLESVTGLKGFEKDPEI